MNRKRKQSQQADLKPKRRPRVTREQLVSAIVEAYEKDSEDLCDEHVDFTTHGPWLLVRLSDDCGWAGYCLFCVEQDRIDKFYAPAYAAWLQTRNREYRYARVDTFSCDASLVDNKNRGGQQPGIDSFVNPFVPEQATQFCPCFARKFFVRLNDDEGEADHVLTFCEEDLDSGSEDEGGDSKPRPDRLQIDFPALSYEAMEAVLVQHVQPVEVARKVLEYLVWLHNLREVAKFSCGCESA